MESTQGSDLLMSSTCECLEIRRCLFAENRTGSCLNDPLDSCVWLYLRYPTLDFGRVLQRSLDSRFLWQSERDNELCSGRSCLPNTNCQCILSHLPLRAHSPLTSRNLVFLNFDSLFWYTALYVMLWSRPFPLPRGSSNRPSSTLVS